MPSMFSKRRGSSNPPVNRATSAAATTAASQAFLQSSASTASLSNAAAAAALRSYTTSPEPVGNITTKRMARRASAASIGSEASVGNGARGTSATRAGLQRQNSGGSMTERTFRSPSPGRPEAVASPAPDVPPVPPLPQALRGQHQRSVSLGPGAGSPTTQTATRGRSANRSSESERDENKGSVNFSRPMSVQGSPITPPVSPPQKPVHGTGSWFTAPSGGASLADAKPTTRPKTADGVAAHETAALRQSIQAAATKPVKKNQISNSAQGSHLLRASVKRPASTTPSELDDSETETYMVYDTNSRTFVARRRPREKKTVAPLVSQSKQLPPGTYDPNTRKIVPARPETGNNQSMASAASDSELAPMVKKKRQRPIPPAVDTSLQPPPRNPARISPSNSPTSTRVSGVLQKQPSIVREDPEAEAAAEAVVPGYAAGLKDTERTIQTSAGPAKAYIAPIRSHQRSASLDIPRSPATPSDNSRRGSISPARSAHFPSSPVIEALKHSPPARGLSPAKSALKHSPSTSVRDASPTTTFSQNGAKVAPSDASDTTSLASQDGIAGMKKKKSVRVSFDEQPHDMDASSAATPDPKALIRERSPRYDADDDMDEIMKPRPALPSFGSVRKNRTQPEPAQKVTERPPDRHETSSDQMIGALLASEGTKRTVNNDPLPPDVTTRDEVASLSDYSEDEGPDAGFHPAVSNLPSSAEPKVQDFAIGRADGTGNARSTGLQVPDISLQPPTPGLDDETKKIGSSSPNKRHSFERFVVPGAWGEESEDTTDEETKPIIPQDVAVRESEVDEQATMPASTDDFVDIEEHVARPNTRLSDIAESDSDDSAAFSDAAEEPHDYEDGGFASLDAIVESPLVPSPVASPIAIATPPDSPTNAKMMKKAQSEMATEDVADWSAATTYWSKLSKQQRQQMEREHLSSDEDTPTPAAPASPKIKKKKSALKQGTSPALIAASQQSQQSSHPPAMRQSMRTQPAPVPADNSTHMRKSMRGAQPAPVAVDTNTQMRKSMRDGQGSMKGSMRGGPRPQSEYLPSRGPLQKDDNRPMSAGGLSTAAAGGAMGPSKLSSQALSQAGTLPSAGKKLTGPPTKGSTLPKTTADDSDSESSFRKKRRPSTSTVDSQGRFNMRRSMRAGSIDSTQRVVSPTPAARGAGTFSLRSLSPSGSVMSSRNQGEKLRESLRGNSMDAGTRSLRGPTTMRGSAPSSRLGGKTSRPATSSGVTSRFKSRFADSDDEEERDRGRGGMFRSRFADSDDEDDARGSNVMMADLAPVRGIPRRKGQTDGDSTDLSEEDEQDGRKSSRKRNKQSVPIVPDPNDVEKAMAAARRNLGLTNGNSTPVKQQGGTLQKGSLRDQNDGATARAASPSVASIALDQPKKRGLMDSILRRNRPSSSSVTQINFSPASTQAPPLPTGTNSTPNAVQTEQVTPSTPSSPSVGKLIRRKSSQPRLKRGDSNFSNATAPVMGRLTPLGKDVDWPLPSPKLPTNGSVAGGGQRPSTSDGIHERAVELARTMRPDLIGKRSESAQYPASIARQANETDEQHVGFKEDVVVIDGANTPVAAKDANAIYSSKTGKKKKFGRLRRALGLYD